MLLLSLMGLLLLPLLLLLGRPVRGLLSDGECPPSLTQKRLPLRVAQFRRQERPLLLAEVGVWIWLRLRLLLPKLRLRPYLLLLRRRLRLLLRVLRVLLVLQVLRVLRVLRRPL